MEWSIKGWVKYENFMVVCQEKVKKIFQMVITPI